MPILTNPKHEKFAREYVKDYNGTQAAIRAGYAKGNSAKVQGVRLLANATVADRVAELTGKHMKAADITAERVMQELGKIAFAETKAEIKVADKTTALRMLAQRFKLIGSDGDEALNNIAGALAERMEEARQRRRGGE